jgi:hypothetical protein
MGEGLLKLPLHLVRNAEVDGCHGPLLLVNSSTNILPSDQAEVVLERSARGTLHLTPQTLALADDRGRVLVLDLEYGQVRRDLQLLGRAAGNVSCCSFTHILTKTSAAHSLYRRLASAILIGESQDVPKGQRGLKVFATALLLGTIPLAESCTSWRSHSLKVPPNGRFPVAIESLDEGRIRVKREGRKLVVDLVREISGCTGRTYDRTVNEEYEGGAGFEIVDETEKAPYIYLVLLASAQANCNIQGRCGAAMDSTLIWLKLTRELGLVGEQSFAVDDCKAERSARIEGEGDPDFLLKAKDLTWAGDILQIQYEESVGGSETLWRLIYDRQNPGAGFQRTPDRGTGLQIDP